MSSPVSVSMVLIRGRDSAGIPSVLSSTLLSRNTALKITLGRVTFGPSPSSPTCWIEVSQRTESVGWRPCSWGLRNVWFSVQVSTFW